MDKNWYFNARLDRCNFIAEHTIYIHTAYKVFSNVSHEITGSDLTHWQKKYLLEKLGVIFEKMKIRVNNEIYLIKINTNYSYIKRRIREFKLFIVNWEVSYTDARIIYNSLLSEINTEELFEEQRVFSLARVNYLYNNFIEEIKKKEKEELKLKELEAQKIEIEKLKLQEIEALKIKEKYDQEKKAFEKSGLKSIMKLMKKCKKIVKEHHNDLYFKRRLFNRQRKLSKLKKNFDPEILSNLKKGLEEIIVLSEMIHFEREAKFISPLISSVINTDEIKKQAPVFKIPAKKETKLPKIIPDNIALAIQELDTEIALYKGKINALTVGRHSHQSNNAIFFSGLSNKADNHLIIKYKKMIIAKENLKKGYLQLIKTMK